MYFTLKPDKAVCCLLTALHHWVNAIFQRFCPFAKSLCLYCWFFSIMITYLFRGGHSGRDRVVVGFTSTCTISVYHHWSCEFESLLWRGLLDATLSDKVCQWIATGFLHQKNWQPQYNCNIVETGVKHHNPTSLSPLIICQWCWLIFLSTIHLKIPVRGHFKYVLVLMGIY